MCFTQNVFCLKFCPLETELVNGSMPLNSDHSYNNYYSVTILNCIPTKYGFYSVNVFHLTYSCVYKGFKFRKFVRLTSV